MNFVRVAGVDVLLLLYSPVYSSVIHKSMRPKCEPPSEELHISAKVDVVQQRV